MRIGSLSHIEREVALSMKRKLIVLALVVLAVAAALAIRGLLGNRGACKYATFRQVALCW